MMKHLVDGMINRTSDGEELKLFAQFISMVCKDLLTNANSVNS